MARVIWRHVVCRMRVVHRLHRSPMPSILGVWMVVEATRQEGAASSCGSSTARAAAQREAPARGPRLGERNSRALTRGAMESNAEMGCAVRGWRGCTLAGGGVATAQRGPSWGRVAGPQLGGPRRGPPPRHIAPRAPPHVPAAPQDAHAAGASGRRGRAAVGGLVRTARRRPSARAPPPQVQHAPPPSHPPAHARPSPSAADVRVPVGHPEGVGRRCAHVRLA